MTLTEFIENLKGLNSGLNFSGMKSFLILLFKYIYYLFLLFKMFFLNLCIVQSKMNHLNVLGILKLLNNIF